MVSGQIPNFIASLNCFEDPSDGWLRSTPVTFNGSFHNIYASPQLCTHLWGTATSCKGRVTARASTSISKLGYLLALQSTVASVSLKGSITVRSNSVFCIKGILECGFHGLKI